MRTKSIVKKINTICGKTITYLQTEEHPNKMHSIEGPALVYSREENNPPEYYLYGIKYSKAEWKEKISQHKTLPVTEIMFDTQY
jgi:hypothetical protein